MRKRVLLSLFLIGLVIILGIILYSTIKDQKKLTAELPNLLIGESVGEIELIPEDAASVNKFQMNIFDIAAIFIFSRPCKPCNKNIPFWRRISAMKKAEVFGIILEDVTEMDNFSESMNLNFRLYTPESIKEFEKRFRMKFSLAQTLLLKRGKVIYVKVGQLTTEDYFEIAKNLKKGGK